MRLRVANFAELIFAFEQNLYNSSRFCLLYFILGRPSKGKYSGLSNAEKYKLHRSKGSEQKKKKNALRKKLWHANLKTNAVEYEQFKVNKRYRKLQRNKEKETVELEEDGECSSSQDS